MAVTTTVTKRLETMTEKGQLKADPAQLAVAGELDRVLKGLSAVRPAEKGGRSPRPFCSRRCADIDLGRWFQERYAIPAVEGADDSIVESLAGAGRPPEQE